MKNAPDSLIVCPSSIAGVPSPRRRLLDDSDDLLDETEVLRMAGQVIVPPALAHRVEDWHRRATGRRVGMREGTLADLHELLLCLQHPLLRSNPRYGGTELIVAEQSGLYRSRTEGDVTWKELALPSPHGLRWPDWLALMEQTVERAFDRWCYAQHHARRACEAKSTQPAAADGLAVPAVRMAQRAWANYWQLIEEMERILEHAGEEAAA